MGSSINDMSMDKPPRLPKSAPKVELTLVSGPGAGQTIELTRCVSLVGSRPGCKLQLKSPELSPVHFAIVNTAEDVYLRDLVSHTGTLLNDLPALHEKLEDGDTIRVGDWEIRVRITAYTLDTLSDLPHVFLEPEPAAFGVELNGAGKIVKLPRAVNLIGRRDGCDVVLRDKEVSRAHAILFTYMSQPVFCDLLSNNGVQLQGTRAAFGILHSGDMLQIGPKTLRMILPGVGRRKTVGGSSGDASRLVTANGAGERGRASSRGLEDSGEGTAVPLDGDASDRVDIRTAELDGRR